MTREKLPRALFNALRAVADDTAKIEELDIVRGGGVALEHRQDATNTHKEAVAAARAYVRGDNDKATTVAKLEKLKKHAERLRATAERGR